MILYLHKQTNTIYEGITRSRTYGDCIFQNINTKELVEDYLSNYTNI